MPISGPILCEKANYFYTLYQATSWGATDFFLWYKHKKEAEPTTLLHLQKLHTLASRKRSSNLKQTTWAAFIRKE